MAASALDRQYDKSLAALTAPGGRLVIERDAQGRQIVANFPATLPAFFKTFCALHAATEAVVSGDERLTFADLDAWSDRLASALVARGFARGDRIGIAMRNCPAWIVAYMAALKAGAVASLLNGWWQVHELDHALTLIDPKLIIADAARAHRIGATSGDYAIASARPAATMPSPTSISTSRWPKRWRRCLRAPKRAPRCPTLRPRTTRPYCSPRARPVRPRARCRPTAR